MEATEILNNANQFRKSGNFKQALQLYDLLLESNPDNENIIFNKALCYVDTDPKFAMFLLGQVIAINPNLTAVYGNIVVLANKTANYNLGITIFNGVLNNHQLHLEAIYHRAVLIGNSGDFLKALLDFYFVLENSILIDNPDLFLKHTISTDIAFSKTQLRNETSMISLNEDISKFYPGIRMKEYQYKLPILLFGNENYLLDFGKMMGFTIKEVMDKQPEYIPWCILNLDNFCVSEEIIEMLRLKEVNINECKKINTIKLKIKVNDEIEDEIDNECFDEDTNEDDF